jgi:hypothetical protein
MGYPPEFFVEHYGKVPYTNGRYSTRANAPLTLTGQKLENRERQIRALGASLQSFNNRRAELGYYKHVGATPVTRSPSPKRSWCNFLGRCFTRKRR